ncbi:MAG: AMP-binding protein, partial [Polyangiaceae bacterium]
RSLANRLHWMQAEYGLAATDTVLHKTPFSFDVSVWEFFWPLMVGARLAIASPGDHRDPARLVELIQQHGVTTVHFVPSMLQAFLAYPQIEACESLRRVVCSGEVLAVDTQRQVFQRLPGVALHNLYGPTEAAIDVTHWTCREEQRSQVAIGQPISDTKTYVLDADLNLAPLGVAGELYLGGVGLARGYVGRAALSAERFVADPLAADGGRLYRTGDWARFRDDGQLEYLGRVDQQLKIRGFRVELGEIEAQLLAQPGLKEAALLAKDGPRGPELVAYVALLPGAALDAATLRERLARALPDYMVPGSVVFLDQLPLGPNGKLDRSALPEPSRLAPAVQEAPQGDTEQALSRIWAAVLGLESVGRSENFFDLGGHSLLLTRIHAKVRDQFKRQISIVDLFRYPTVAGLASFLSQPPTTVQDSQGALDVQRRAEQQRGAFSRRKAATGRTPR